VQYPALVSILGGGQLARMSASAAARLGIEVAILEREPDSPAARVAVRSLVGGFDDRGMLLELARDALAVTLENEFVDVPSLHWLQAQGVPVFPAAETLSRIQDKLEQKRFLQTFHIPMPQFIDVHSREDITSAAQDWGWPLLLKLRRNSYDGYGNATLHGPEDIAAALNRLRWPEQTLLAEAWVPFARELAVMVARGRDGQAAVYPVVETVQQNHICHLVRAPASVPPPVVEQATRIALQAVEAVEGVGIFAIELFETPQGRVLYNEIAPRPHNSGHYTIEGSITSQFENHLRAILGLPLGSTQMTAPAAVMVNILGTRHGPATVDGLPEALAITGASVHIYGKLVSRPGRKMGHVTVLGESIADAEERALAAAKALTI
jgi:5-(carboxyamino)imidazole ribonucleotide synthase